jgi:hypothetical protein
MSIDQSRIRTQDQTGEAAPTDQVEDRVEAEIKLIESQAKEKVADGLQDEALRREARELKKEAESDLDVLDGASAKKSKS